MKTLITQKEFADKMGIKPSNLSRDFVKKGILPMEGKKIIMPDAEKIFYRFYGGVVEYKEQPKPPQPNNVIHWRYTDNAVGNITFVNGALHTKLPVNKQLQINSNTHGIEIDNSDFIYTTTVAVNKLYVSANTEIKTGINYINVECDNELSIVIVDDEVKAKAITSLDSWLLDVEDNTYLLTKSELKELIKAKLGDKSYL